MSPRNSTKVKTPKEPKAKKAKEPKVKKAKAPKAPVRKVPADVYTLVLLLGFIFFLGAVVMLYLDYASYK